MTTRKTFQFDNKLAEWMPKLYGSKLAPQLMLPGFDKPPFGPFDLWATMALYALLDPKKPADSVIVKPSELLDVLRFAKDISLALGGTETFRTSDYHMVEQALHRLRSIPLDLRARWKVKLPGKKGRPKSYVVDFHGNILDQYAYIYPDYVTPADLLPPGERDDVNLAKDLVPDAPPIWKAKTGPRPVGIMYRLNRELVMGLTEEDPNIGATTMPYKIFELRKVFGKNPTGTRLLVWVMRQTNQTGKRDLDALASTLRLEPRQKGRNRDNLIIGFELLKENNVIEDFSIEKDEGTDKITVTFTKRPDWYMTDENQEEIVEPEKVT